MMNQFKNALPEYAKDIKLNLDSVLTEAGAADLTQKQIDAIALASAYASRNYKLAQALQLHADTQLMPDEMNAMKAAATIMAMNNVYYRFTHVMNDQSYASMPAKLRMNIIANPGVDKALFELACLAVSAINNCSKCMNAHAFALEKINISKTAIQSAVRIASVIHAAAVSDEMRD